MQAAVLGTLLCGQPWRRGSRAEEVVGHVPRGQEVQCKLRAVNIKYQRGTFGHSIKHPPHPCSLVTWDAVTGTELSGVACLRLIEECMMTRLGIQALRITDVSEETLGQATCGIVTQDELQRALEHLSGQTDAGLVGILLCYQKHNSSCQKH